MQKNHLYETKRIFMISIKKIATSLLLALISVSMSAQETAANHKFQVRVEGATYNSMGWGIEGGINYYPIKYVGVGASICGAGDFTSTAKTFNHDGIMYSTGDLHNAVWFRCGVQLRSPDVWKNSDGSLRISIKEDCGITIPIPTNKNIEFTAVPDSPGTHVDPVVQHIKNTGATSAFFHTKTAVALDIERWQVWLGYTWSNMDVYSSSRNATTKILNQELPRPKNLSGVHIGLGYSF